MSSSWTSGLRALARLTQMRNEVIDVAAAARRRLGRLVSRLAYDRSQHSWRTARQNKGPLGEGGAQHYRIESAQASHVNLHVKGGQRARNNFLMQTPSQSAVCRLTAPASGGYPALTPTLHSSSDTPRCCCNSAPAAIAPAASVDPLVIATSRHEVGGRSFPRLREPTPARRFQRHPDIALVGG